MGGTGGRCSRTRTRRPRRRPCRAHTVYMGGKSPGLLEDELPRRPIDDVDRREEQHMLLPYCSWPLPPRGSQEPAVGRGRGGASALGLAGPRRPAARKSRQAGVAELALQEPADSQAYARPAVGHGQSLPSACRCCPARKRPRQVIRLTSILTAAPPRGR
jgi:hypothetical protein